MQTPSNNSFLQSEQHLNIIKETRRIIKGMAETQRFIKAENHIQDALKYKQPRAESERLDVPITFRILYSLEVSSLWESLLFYLSYTFLYFVIMDNQSYTVKIGLESAALGIFWIDTIIEIYTKTFDNFRANSRFSKTFYAKVFFLSLMVIDLIIFIALPCYNSRPIRPFRFFRAFIPLFYDSQMRKSFQSFASAWKDILTFIFFYVVIILSFAIVGSKLLNVVPDGSDDYRMNYTSVDKNIFITYVLATYDSYPDNQMDAIQQFMPNYFYFILFVFLNMFLFSSIPGSLIYTQFKETRSKIILLDEMKQQHSLILAFVTLTVDNPNLELDVLIRFLLHVYKYKIRYVEYITDICLSLDDNNSRSIQANEFMRLTKILLANPAMLPPKFYDVEWWVCFRKFMNTTLYLKKIVTHWLFQLIVSILIIACFSNALYLIFAANPSNASQVFDQILVFVFVGELILRIIGIGPQNFFADQWNLVDFFIVIISFCLQLTPSSNVNTIIRMSRIFRIGSFFRLLSHSSYLQGVQSSIYHKIRNLFLVMLIIMPIILKFLPLFLLFFYWFGIVGMEAFYTTYTNGITTAYNFYDPVGHFRSFLYTQFVMIQVLTEAGWSMIAFDHAGRNANNYGFVMLFFCLMHITIVYMIAALIKGIFWEVYFTVNGQLETRTQKETEAKEQEKIYEQKKHQFLEISTAISMGRAFEPDTVIKRQLYENKFDLVIFSKLKALINKQQKLQVLQLKDKDTSRKFILDHMLDDRQIGINELDQSDEVVSNYNAKSSRRISAMNLSEIDEAAEEDFEEELEMLLSSLIINPKVKYSETIVYPKIFVEFIESRMIKSRDQKAQNEFNVNRHFLSNQESMNVHIYEVHSLLNIETSKRQQKAMIIKLMVQSGVLAEEGAEELIKKKLIERNFTINSNGILREMYLTGTNESLINKFEVEYFSDIYGYSFKEINKLSLEPLLRYEATLTYCLRNICRYPQIDNTEFFEMLTHIEDSISNKLLKRGSLFKFVYMIDHVNDIWFSIEYKHQQQMRIHFIKTGIWAYTKQMEEKEIYYGKDIFNWEMSNDYIKSMTCEKYIKRFYQSFEGLAFSLLQEDKFFYSNPKYHVYDLYTQFLDVTKVSRYIPQRLEISKIMMVVLSKEEERAEIGLPLLPYDLSQISPHQEKKKDINFKFDESEKETFEKLKNLSAMDHERIVESEGLPFAYINNLMKQVQDILQLYQKNFINQIQKVLNEEFERTPDCIEKINMESMSHFSISNKNL